MSRNIKHLKPRKGHFKQGYFDGYDPKKYIGPRPIIYRSSLEYRFMLYCEREATVKAWTSEPFAIKYIGDDGKEHNYWIDFVTMMDDGTKVLVEVKPSSQVPINEAQINLNPVMRKNAQKWAAVMKHCKSTTGVRFKIITEKFFK